MRGILADNDISGQFQVLLYRLESDAWRGLWHDLNLSLFTFEDIGLPRTVSDSVLWHVCQQQGILLLTGNRNKHAPDSLEATIERSNSPTRLPVFTIADPEQVLQSPAYAARVVTRLLEYLIDIDNYRGTGRLCLP